MKIIIMYPKRKIGEPTFILAFNVLSSTFNILSTLSECGKYSNYYVIAVPGININVKKLYAGLVNLQKS